MPQNIIIELWPHLARALPSENGLSAFSILRRNCENFDDTLDALIAGLLATGRHVEIVKYDADGNDITPKPEAAATEAAQV